MAGPYDLRIAIVGAGMGGLGCALSLARKGFKHIDVYESAAELGFVGAGIQMAPNMARILDRLGCWADIAAEATNVQETSIREGSSNAELAHVDMSRISAQYGYPHCTGHRASLARGLYRACLAEPAVAFHFSTALAGIDQFAPRPVLRLQRAPTNRPDTAATTTTTTTAEVDVLLAADGIKSITRGLLLGRLGLAAEEAETGLAAYRITLTRDQIEGAAATAGADADADADANAELLRLVDSDLVVRWIGESRHVIAYPVAGKTVYNVSTVQPDVHFAAAPSAAYTTRAPKRAMLAVFADFCPLVRRLLSMAPDGDVCEWRLRQHRALPAWVHGAVALLGDACHPTLPHLSQGAAMAIEDGAVLADVLSRVDTTAHSGGGGGATAATATSIHRCLKTYELLRKARTALLVDMAFDAGRALHLGEGPAREERDRQFAAHQADGTAAIPDKWVSPDVQNMIYAYDCVADAAARFDELHAMTV